MGEMSGGLHPDTACPQGLLFSGELGSSSHMSEETTSYARSNI